ncbi:MAG: membrane protein insertion efficiency factor YidD [Clostridia bacterium]|nr:membrane protein insertion efficiency factor YidD [Clostridia bacterium]
MKHVMIWLIGLYRKFISPLKPPCCRFTPTCSAYAIEAFKKRGFFVGLFLTVWRILRCNPFSKGGYDPVPERKVRVSRTSRQNGDKYITDTQDEKRKK